MERPTILLLCQPGRPRQVYLRELAEVEASVVVEDDCSTFLSHYEGRRLSGVLVDVPTQARSPKEDKAIVNELVDAYPTLRVRYDDSAKAITTLFFGQRRGVSISIPDFVREQCAGSSPRIFRVVDRRPLTLPVRVSDGPSPGDDAVRTVTLNLAPGGAFLYGVDAWRVGQKVWLAFEGLGRAIEAEVCWIQPWGAPRTFPGVGVKFLESCECEIATLISRVAPA